MNPFKKFDTLCRQHAGLSKQRLQAIKKWNVAKLDELDALINENLRQSNATIEEMKQMELKLANQ